MFPLAGKLHTVLFLQFPTIYYNAAYVSPLIKHDTSLPRKTFRTVLWMCSNHRKHAFSKYLNNVEFLLPKLSSFR